MMTYLQSYFPDWVAQEITESQFEFKSIFDTENIFQISENFL